MAFKFYKQLDSMDCGPSCLKMITNYYGKKYAIKQLRDGAYIQKTGVNLLGLSEIAEKIGFRTTGVRTSIEKLTSQATLPCILHWNQEHFVVLYEIKVKKGKYIFRIADPSYGLIDYNESDFRKCWITTRQNRTEKGIALILSPTPEFYEKEPIKYDKISLTFLLKYLKPYKKLITQLFIGFIAGSLLQLVFPFLTQLIVDQGIGGQSLSLIQIILLAQLVLMVSRTLIEIIRRWILLHVSTRVNVALMFDFLVKLMKLPLRYFDSKLAADLLRRMEDHKNIQVFLTQSIINILFSGITVFVFSIVLLMYSWEIFLIFLIGTIIYILWIRLFMKKRADINHKNFEQNTKNQDNIIQIIYGMQEIKLCGNEEQKRWEWQSTQASLFRLNVKSLNLGQWQETGGILINELKNILIIAIAATFVLSGSITLGAMLSIQYIIGQMQGPIQQLILFLQQAQDANISLERLGEVHNLENEEHLAIRRISDIEEDKSITIKDLSFTYGSEKSPKVLKNITFDIPKGKTTAIVGLSGSGKTTILKLILGFYAPTEGKMMIGNTSIQDISLKEWRKNCGVVMQEGFIFNDTIANNIATTSSDEIDKNKLMQAIRMANLKEYIEGLPLKYNTKIGNSGVGLSQGQKQRILIARAIYKDPNYILFDEATNALDSQNEKIIMENLKQFFKEKTVLIVAHRLSTVRNAEQIIVLRDGEIKEKGTHNELIALKSEYFELVKNQLELGN